MARYLGQLNDLFIRPLAVADSSETKASLEPFIAPIDVVTVRSSTCRESMFLEHDVIRQQQRLEELAANQEPSEVVELATTMRIHQKERNPFSNYVEPKLRRFVCSAYNGVRAASTTATTSAAADQANNGLNKRYQSKNTNTNVYYRSPWSNLRQTVIDVPQLSAALLEESDATPEITMDAGADHTKCPIIAHYQKEAMHLFSHEQLSLHRKVVESHSTGERLAKAREVEVLLNKMLGDYLDAYYASAEEIANKNRTAGPLPPQDLVASALVKDNSFERAGHPRQYFLEINTIIRNRTKVAEGLWEVEEESSQSCNTSQTRAPFRSWTTVHTATVHQINKEVKAAMSSRLLIHQTTRKEVSLPTKKLAEPSSLAAEEGADDDLDIDPIAIYGPQYATKSAEPFVMDLEASISNMSWSSNVFQVSKDEDVLVVLPQGIAQMIGDSIQNAENDFLVPSLLDVLSSSTVDLISGIRKRREFNSRAPNASAAADVSGDDDDDIVGDRTVASKLPTTRLANEAYHGAALEIASKAAARGR